MVKPKLPEFSYGGSDEVVEFSELQWTKLATLLGCNLSDQDHEHLIYLCNEYMHWRRPEQEGASYRDASENISKLKSICRELQIFAWGEFEGKSAAASWLSRQVFAELKKSLIVYSDYQIQHTETDDFEVINIPPVHFRLTENVFMQITTVLTNSIKIVENQIELGVQGSAAAFRNGDAFELFLKNLRLFAKEKGVPHSGWTRTNEVPSKLSEFAFELNKPIPKNRRTNVSSQKRMATRIDLVQSPA